MSDSNDRISFDVETSRILEILSREIYDSPHALLRENIQNAYDATLMRAAEEGGSIEERSIQVSFGQHTITISDDGIGMTEEVLKSNFWRAGSSGKNSDLARRAGVVGTFGIGAMANFGIATTLRVETRAIHSDTTLISTAIRDELQIGRDCIRLDRIRDNRPPGTTVIAELDPAVQFNPEEGRKYLDPFVRFLPVRTTLDGQLISQQSYESAYETHMRGVVHLSSTHISDTLYGAQLDIYLSNAVNVVARLSDITLEGTLVKGQLLLIQDGGQLFGYRSYFGLAPIPVSSHYQFGGVANLAVLQPTAGREALSRESIEHVNRLVRIAEASVSEAVAPTDIADRNPRFLQYVHAQGRLDLAGQVTIDVLPDDKPVPLGDIPRYCEGREAHYYTGRDQAILRTFTSGTSVLLHVSQNNPRRALQVQYVTEILRIPEVPDCPTITKIYSGPELTMAEAALLVRVTTTLAEDYLFPITDVHFADISHGVGVFVETNRDTFTILLARDSAIVRPVLECYRSAYEVFGGFVKDFVRVHLYQHISQYLPSSTRQGADALVQILQRNRELFRYEENELGLLDPLLYEFLAGDISIADVIQSSAAVRQHTQTVTSAQVGSIEDQIPSIVGSPAQAPEEAVQQYGAAPPIIRDDISSTMKVLLATMAYPQLNNFELFLSLSDRIFKREGLFFHAPHSTKIIWASHRVIYIFTHASGTFTLYYDIELRDPLHEQKTGGGLFPTTTIVTNNRIYVPVPSELVPAFRVTEGAKEFYVRFDVL
jgi:molecular chaperone HtpG